MCVLKMLRQKGYFINECFLVSCLDPFQWAWLPMAKTPFSDEIADLVLDKLKDLEFVQELGDDLRRLFRVSKKCSGLKFADDVITC